MKSTELIDNRSLKESGGEMTLARMRRIDVFRKAQPRAELERKADKARRRGIWTQEEMDAADAEAKVLFEALHKTERKNCE